VAGIYGLGHACERVAAAATAAASLGVPFTLTARAENHIRGNPDIDDTVARLRAFEAAGADVAYAPGLRTVDEIRAVWSALTIPLNVLATGTTLTLAEMTAAGTQRVSLGGGLTWVAVEAAASVAVTIRDRGDFSGLRPTPLFRHRPHSRCRPRPPGIARCWVLGESGGVAGRVQALALAAIKKLMSAVTCNSPPTAS